ncbi:hypothetical protein A3B42_00805 [Candidatus Daviesbacteria bacterium RIFCSPLOWO2_01_FULL_38_10]|nr:MAG: hypothetical protein US80_C0010G0027 [Candidatus Daviesbacteria bacterium GW2011_GWA2_38_17]OGE26005.1 MAG: hypothetical protein A3D02_00640 [Candidatus Daviesbacteria bacterium RIFCSPHIGHO2_02_FULL_39_41]OGE39460.1 MAG: hypothetical protein A3B42_00805 [Candidatus Daviesbacteria bacterium RIFCSPLOWO2_01_FULL_38_10]OGE45729.1 MAG: hypothetical protein A3E67_01005 [Candidatus Daviesbacteria bacterium RIFCSPHIGHO2_12_FULL_38_25]OGE68170.1 MAG: hypothetical protein A3H81_04740 [Candidatus 
MDENTNSINQKTGILLSRNTPLALVVGAAGFLGSHLVDVLLNKGLQVVGLDDLIKNKKANLEQASKNKNFHLLISSPAELDLDLTRLDYIYVIPQENWNLKEIFKYFKKHSSRFLLVSSVKLYDAKTSESLLWLKKMEGGLAGFAADNSLNARILRLGPVFGPRMDFTESDPIARLIYASLKGELQNETLVADFSARSLYVEDAIDLTVKSMLSGATALRIFDGVLPVPIKVAEIKQVLLDPVWYDQKGFTPQELPPWPTPNLQKTIQFLNWQPKTGLVAALRETLSFFKDKEIDEPAQLEQAKEDKKDVEWGSDKKEELEAFKQIEQLSEKKVPAKKPLKLPKINLPKNKIFLCLCLVLVFYALVWPAIRAGVGVLTFRIELSKASENLSKGDFEAGLKNVSQAKQAVLETKAIFSSLEPLKEVGFLKDQFKTGEELSNLGQVSADAAGAAVEGIKLLYQGLRAVTGEINDSPKEYFNSSRVELAKAYEDLAYAEAQINDEEFLQRVPRFLLPRISSLKERLGQYSGLVKRARAAAAILPEIVAMEGEKNYLILLQNNMELRPTGGFIGSFAVVNFQGGKLRTLKVNDVYVIDGQLSIHVEPPKEIKEDLGQVNWYLRDANWEPDFPTSAKQIEWFYTKETGDKVWGVITLDVSGMENLLSVLGPLDLPDYNETITQENLFERAVTHAEAGFFPGSQAKKSFLTALVNQTLNKIFFSSGQNWPGIVSSMGKSLEEKHMLIYLDDPKLFSFVVSENWAGAMPRPSSKKEALFQDFLSLNEANLGANKANYYLSRNYHLETVIGKDGEIRHRLKINYLNASPGDVWPAGKYKNRVRLYLPFGSKLIRALWGETDITHTVSNFADFGRSGYSFPLTLLPQEQKSLILDYEIAGKLEFKDNRSSYRIDIIKQPGTLKEPLEWKLVYPINYQLEGEQGVIGPQEQVISSDLSKDRSFEVQFSK